MIKIYLGFPTEFQRRPSFKSWRNSENETPLTSRPFCVEMRSKAPPSTNGETCTLFKLSFLPLLWTEGSHLCAVEAVRPVASQIALRDVPWNSSARTAS